MLKTVGNFLALLCVAALPTIGATANSPRTNVVFILADDLGWADLGCYGSTFYETPHLDRLARQGMRFTDAYAAASVCSPTRAAILTGKSPARLHLTDWLTGRPDRPDQKLNRPAFQMFLPLEEVTLAEALRAAGYRTAAIGKWHLGEATNYFPEQQGFDWNVAGSGKGHPPSYFSPYSLPNLKDGPKGEHLNDRLTDEAERFMRQAAQEAKPFFLYLSHYAVHTPLQAKPETLAKYRQKAQQLTNAQPAFASDQGRNVRQVQNLPVYGAMMEDLDASVGRLLAAIQDLGIESHTIVIFTSDNGGLSTAEGTPTSNNPLRMGKGWGYEGGVRVPLVVKWPGVIKSGSVTAEPVSSADFYPTILTMLGLPLRPQQHLDGVSFAAVLQAGELPARSLYWHYPHYSNQGGAPHGAVRAGQWKLIEQYEDSRVELYNLVDDIGEKSDLAQTHAEIAKRLQQQLKDWRTSVAAQMPSPNPNYRPRAIPAAADR